MIILTLFFFLLNQQSSPLEGNWYYCDNGDYVELHFKATYFENCPEYAPFGISYPYKISGDTIVYNLQNETHEIIIRRFLVMNDDSVKLMKDFSGKKKEILLVKLRETIEVPSSTGDITALDAYEEEFNKRKGKYQCHN